MIFIVYALAGVQMVQTQAESALMFMFFKLTFGHKIQIRKRKDDDDADDFLRRENKRQYYFMENIFRMEEVKFNFSRRVNRKSMVVEKIFFF